MTNPDLQRDRRERVQHTAEVEDQIFDAWRKLETPEGGKELEKQLERLSSSAKQIDMLTKMEGDIEMKQRMVQKFLGEVTESGAVNVAGDKEKALRYGYIVLGRVAKIYTEERITSLQDAFDTIEDPEVDPHYKIMEEIVDGNAFTIPSAIESEDYKDEVDGHRYFIRKKNRLGAIGVSGRAIAKDLKKFDNGLPLSTAAQKFRAFLEELGQADPIEYQTHITLPEYAERYEPQSLKEAKGALKALALLGLVSGAALSAIAERNNDFPTVTALYLGTAALVYRPTLFSDGPLERMKRTLSFTMPHEGTPDKWAELMNGSFSGRISGTQGREIFDILLESSIQRASKDRYSEKSDNADYFLQLEENGMDASHIHTLKDIENQRPDLFRFLLLHTSEVKVPADQIVLLQFVEEKMTGESIPPKFAVRAPTPNNTRLGEMGKADYTRTAEKK